MTEVLRNKQGQAFQRQQLQETRPAQEWGTEGGRGVPRPRGQVHPWKLDPVGVYPQREKDGGDPPQSPSRASRCWNLQRGRHSRRACPRRDRQRREGEEVSQDLHGRWKASRWKPPSLLLAPSGSDCSVSWLMSRLAPRKQDQRCSNRAARVV